MKLKFPYLANQEPELYFYSYSRDFHPTLYHLHLWMTVSAVPTEVSEAHSVVDPTHVVSVFHVEPPP